MTGAVQHVEVRAIGPAQVEQVLGTYYPGINLRRGGEVGLSMTMSAVPHLALLDQHFAGPGRSAWDSPDALTVAWYFGSIAATRGRRPLRLGEPLLLAEGARLQAVWDACGVRALTLDPVTVREAAAQYWGRPAPPVLFDEERAISPARAAAWEHLVAFAGEAMARHPETVGEPVVQHSLVRHLAVTLLHTYPNALLADPPRIDVHDGAPVSVRRALEYIDEHAQDPVTVDDVAEAVHLSTRGLQVAFRRTLDTTPSARLRRSRLDGAHHDLLSAEPGSTTVAAVARRWGFAHPGRFAAAYRDAYGEPPAATLRR